MKLLVISLAGIGDTILATPLIHELRANFPDARIDSLVLWAGSKDILEGNPHLNRIYQRNLIKEDKLESLRWLRDIGRNAYDISINTHPQSRMHYRMTSWIVGSQMRISHIYECFTLVDRVLVNRTLPQDYLRHTVHNNISILSLLGKRPALPSHELELFLSDSEENWAEEWLSRKGLKGRPLLGVHAGSGGTKNLALKRWPLPCYVRLLQRVRDTLPAATVLLFGGPEEDKEMTTIMGELNSPNVIRAESKSLRQAGALMKRLTAFLSVDTALMHVAAAVKAPGQIVIEAPTLNKTNEPFGNTFTLVRNPAVGGRNLEFYRYDGLGIKGTDAELVRCMESVTVDEVYRVVRDKLSRPPGN